MPEEAVPDALPLRLIAVMVLTHTAFTSMRLALTLAVLQQGGSALAVGVIVSLLMVVPVFSSIPISRWTDGAGHVPAALAGLALIVVGGLVATRQVLPALACGAVLIGSGQAMVQVAIMDAIGHCGGEGVARRFSPLAWLLGVRLFRPDPHRPRDRSCRPRARLLRPVPAGLDSVAAGAALRTGRGAGAGSRPARHVGGHVGRHACAPCCW